MQPKKYAVQFFTPPEISTPGDLNLTPPRIRNNSYYEKGGDLSEIWWFYGVFERKMDLDIRGTDRHSDATAKWFVVLNDTSQLS